MENELKTADEWLELIPKEHKVFIIDADGFEKDEIYSQKITKQDFLNKLSNCTISCKVSFFESEWIKN